MAGLLTGTSYRDAFFNYLRTTGGLTDNSASSYISYINNLCRNMANHNTKGAKKNTAFDVLTEMAQHALSEDNYLRDLKAALQGPKGRPQDLQSAAMQLFHFARNHMTGNGITIPPKPIHPLGDCPGDNEPMKAGDLIFHKIHWLRCPPDEKVMKALDKFFDLVARSLQGALINAQGRDFDKGIRNALKAAGCISVSDLDAQKVFPGANYTFDIKATTPEGIRLLIEIEKTEVKRIIHDILKIAAGQRHDPRAIGLILAPERYRTSNRVFSRTHLQEATAMMELLNYAHPWGGQSIGVVVYEAKN